MYLAIGLPNCLVWAPRWSNNITYDQIQLFHSKGKMVFTWTIDMNDYMSHFLKEIKVDGILTNYPTLLAAKHYSREK